MGKRSELTVIINDYLSKSKDGRIRHCGKSLFLERKLGPFLHNLISFETPDMYAKIGKEVMILEAFQFDGSKFIKHKGLQSIREEKRVDFEFQNFIKSSSQSTFEDSLEYSQTPQDYHDNIFRVFNEHYFKINKYKQVLENKGIVKEDSIIYTGFFIENRNPPDFVNNMDKSNVSVNWINLVFVKQFLDLFEKSQNIDFVLCGEKYEEHSCLYFIDRENLNAYRAHQIDLERIKFLNSYEFIIGAKIQ